VDIISSKSKVGLSKLKEAWTFRSLLFALAWRDIKVRYVQSYLGFLWIVVNPLISLLLLNFIFGTIVEVDTQEVNSIIFTITGLAGWNYFASLVGESGNAVFQAQHMVKKIYFPRIILPLSKAITCLFELLGTFAILVVCLILFDGHISKNIVYFPIFLFLSILAGIACGIWISALTIRFRDLRFIVPVFIRIGFFLTPIAYSSSMIPKKYNFTLFVNPIAGIVDGFRWSILGIGEIGSHIYTSSALILVLLALGIILFFRMEKSVADII